MDSGRVEGIIKKEKGECTLRTITLIGKPISLKVEDYHPWVCFLCTPWKMTQYEPNIFKNNSKIKSFGVPHSLSA